MSYYLYFITNKDSAVKIGVSRDPRKRLKQLQTGNHTPLKIKKLVKLKSRSEAYKLEAELHQKFKNKKILNEWFFLDRDMEKFINTFEEKQESNYTMYYILMMAIFIGLLSFKL